MDKMTLTKAFRIRNVIKEKISQLERDFYAVPKHWDEGKLPDYRASRGKNAVEIYYSINSANLLLHRLNIAINNANKKRAQDLVITISDIKNEISKRKAILTQVVDIEKTRRDLQVKEIDGRNVGERIDVPQVLAFSDDNIKEMQLEIDKFKKDLFHVETELAEVNGITKVEFVIKDGGNEIDFQADLEAFLK